MPTLTHESNFKLPEGFQLVPSSPEVRLPPGFSLIPNAGDARYRSMPSEQLQVPGDPDDPEYQARQTELKRRNQEATEAENQWMARRSIGERAADAASFVAGLPVRLATQGKKGLGDVLEATGFSSAARSVSQAEQDFAKANERGLWYAGAAGEVAAGIPMFHTMGRAAAVPNTVRQDMWSARGANAVADLAAHERGGVRPFGPAWNQGPVASAAKQITETAIVGSPAKNALDESLLGAKHMFMRTAEDIGPPKTFEGAGITLQRGLERFRTAGVEDIEPAILQRLGIEPMAPVQPAEVMSKEAAKLARKAAPIREELGGGTALTSRGVEVPAARSLDQTILARRSADQMSVDELTRLARVPAYQTSFQARADALYALSDKWVPTQFKVTGARNPQEIAAVNTRTALRGIENQIANQIAGQNRISGDLAERILNPHSNFVFDDLRSIRTEIGRALSNFGKFDIGLDRSQLKSLYKAVSQDMEIGLQTIANRAYLATKNSGHAKVTDDAARNADRALFEFRRADRYFRAGMDRMERFMGIVKANKPEAAAQNLINAALEGGRGNMGMVRTAKSALRPEEWNDFSGLAFRELGRPIGSARGTAGEFGFSINSVLTRFNNMAQEGKRLLFGGPHKAAIEDFQRVAYRLANVEATYNTSRSATNPINMGVVTGGASVGGAWGLGLLPPELAAALVVLGVAGTAATGIIMSRPAWARWATRYLQLRARVAESRAPDKELADHILRLGALAVGNDELQGIADNAKKDYERLQRHSAIQEGVGEAQKAIDDLARLMDFNDKAPRGVLPTGIVGGKRAADLIGVPMDALGLKRDASAVDVLQSLGQLPPAKLVQATKGAMSPEELQQFLQMVSQGGSTKQGSAQVLNALKMLNVRKIALAKAADEYRRTTGTVDGKFVDIVAAIHEAIPLMPAPAQG